GFAVVASEIKDLASQSKQATIQVRQILGEIQKATNAAVLSTESVTRGMGQLTETVTRGMSELTEVSAKAGETIAALAETLAETMRTATQIAASAGQQATGTAQIAVAIKNIEEVSKQTIVATHQSKEAADNLNVIGGQLADLVGYNGKWTNGKRHGDSFGGASEKSMIPSIHRG
ncbi:MAG TPA: methyl-accepting chemotaxis protein, partial [Candidatus Binataceae bacterium]|nr:methyl-accepting chemotaxis protein [Candidatus Binataceae bacterium]